MWTRTLYYLSPNCKRDGEWDKLASVLKDTGKTHSQIKLEHLQKVWILACGWLVH